MEENPITSIIPRQLETKARIAELDAQINGPLVEVGQVCGRLLYIRDDLHDPVQLQYVVEQIQSAFQWAFYTPPETSQPMATGQGQAHELRTKVMNPVRAGLESCPACSRYQPFTAAVLAGVPLGRICTCALELRVIERQTSRSRQCAPRVEGH